MTTRKYLAWLVLAMVVLAGPIGCGKREIDELKTKVASLEKELADSKAKLDDAEKEAEEARTKGAQDNTKIDALVAEATKCRVDRDNLRRELAALKRKR